MKQATGFITDDGTFFETEEEARLHEAESVLRGALANLTGDGPNEIDHFLTIVHTIKHELGDYLNATNTYQRHKAEVEDRAEVDDGGTPEVSANIGHVDSTEEDLKALLQFPSRRPSHVPDVGRGPHAEEVQERREEHGSGVRGVNASSVRGGKDMAVEQSTEARLPRSGSGKKDIQKRKVERDLE